MIYNQGNHSVYINKKSIAIFASGTGTNTQNIINYFRHSNAIRVGLILCNNPSAGVIQIAMSEHIPYVIINKEDFFNSNIYVNELKNYNIDFIVLAGFLWKVPEQLINAYRNKIINIHPALLPKFGGRGMYGSNVHAAVLAAGETESGITIHYVDEHYDNGDIIFQAKCPVLATDTPQTLAQKVHELEYAHYPQVIEKTVLKH